MTTIVGKPSATGQPTRTTQPFLLSGSINELELDVCYRVQVATTGKSYGGNSRPVENNGSLPPGGWLKKKNKNLFSTNNMDKTTHEIIKIA